MSDTRTPAEIEAEIEQQREQLAQTVDQLAAKLDVKSQAQAKVEDLKRNPQPLIIAGAVVVSVVALVWWRRHRG